jgi:hypothetical protein
MNGWWDDGSVVVCCYENGPLNVLTPPPSLLSLSLSLSLPIRMELCGMCVSVPLFDSEPCDSQ